MGHLHRRLIAFDLDGTLIDSRQDLADSANQLLVELGKPPLPVERIASMVGEGAGVLVRRALDASGLTHVPSPSALPRFLAIYDERLLNHTVLYPGIAAMVRDARATASLAVLTNKPLSPSARILAALGVGDCFDRVLGGDGPYPRKPDPASLRALMTDAGTDASTTLLVGDSDIDGQTARNAGVPFCLVTYGFRSLQGQDGEARWVVDDATGVARAILEFASDGS